MKNRAKLKDGEVDVGCVVQISISNCDKTKQDARTLSCVVVKVTKSGKFRLACKAFPAKIPNKSSSIPPISLSSAPALIK